MSNTIAEMIDGIDSFTELADIIKAIADRVDEMHSPYDEKYVALTSLGAAGEILREIS